MSKISDALNELNSIENTASGNQWINRIHPLVKLIVTISYIITVVSFSKYDLTGLFAMLVFPAACFIVAELSFIKALKRLKIVLPFVFLMGIFNPFFDKSPVLLGPLTVRAGIISMLTLMLKGIFTVLASYILISTTTIEKLCCALRQIHIPKILVTEILLIYRYISVLLQETGRVTAAYMLRAPGQKGIHFRSWGPLAGSILMRSIERANAVYDSMCLRGYDNEFSYIGKNLKFRITDTAFLLIWISVFIILRIFPVINIIGNFAGGLFQ